MRRYLAGTLFCVLIGQSSGAALATTSNGVSAPSVSLPSIVEPLLNAIENSQIVAQLTGSGDRFALMHMPKPVFSDRGAMRRPITIDVSKTRLAQMHFRLGHLVPVRYPKTPPRQRTRDPLAMHTIPSLRSPLTAPRIAGMPRQRSTVSGASVPTLRARNTANNIGGNVPPTAERGTLTPQSLALSGGSHEKMSQHVLASSDVGAGINRYWEYEEHAVPGIGRAMVNVGTGNLLIQATDVDIPEEGLDLVMQRTYNSQSLHDANGDDGSEPAIFGNGWTNTYDAHLVFRSTGQISVYDIDGTRCDYSPDGHGNWIPCTGEHAILQVDPNPNSCSYWWIKKNGTAYWFYTPTPGGNCFTPPGNVGRLYEIVGRNSNNAVTLAYSFAAGEPQTAQYITEVDVNHSDGQTLKMTFAQAGGSGPNELATITRPDGKPINYYYDTGGDLQEVDRPGNNVASVLPETYGIQHPIQFACGPRATLAKWNNTNDGACLDFDYDSNVNVIDWKVHGVLNFMPGDGQSALLQPSEPTGWQVWYMGNFVYGGGNGTACGSPPTGTTTMCDSDGHSTTWTINSADEVTQTQDFVNSSLSLVTNQTWDANNNLVQFIDPRGHETDYAYDTNANTIAVKHPEPASGQPHPTSVYAYDPHNNLTAYCDPIYSDAHGLDWNSGSWPGTECPGGAGTTHYTWATPSPEPYGQLTHAYTACYNASCKDPVKNVSEPGYHVSYVYNTNGLPVTVSGDTISQPGGSRKPTQTFGYDAYGNLNSYSNGGGSWTLTYDTLNRLITRVDPDSGHPTSYFYYFTDGSTSQTETPYQHSLGKGRTYTYDADGDLATETIHRKGTHGEIDKYYDGLDRLVDVVEPHDNDYDVFQNPWITRYLYDLTEGGTVSFNGSTNYSAYGNLFETQELLLPTGTAPTYIGTTLNNSQFQPLKGTQYDALDRSVGAYAIVNGANALSTTTYDGSSQYGLITQQRKPSVGGTQLYKNFAYDNNALVTSISFSDGTGRSFTYDLAGRKLTAQKDNDGTQTYDYDLEGRIVDSIEPSPPHVTSPATYTHEFYADGKLKQLDVTSSALNQTGLFVDSYQTDGRLIQQIITYGSNINVTVGFNYTAAGRLSSRSESGAGHNGSPTSLSYDSYGQLASTTYPGESTISDYAYDPEGDLMQFHGQTFTYSIRGELLGPNVTGNPLLGYPGSWAFANGAQVQTSTTSNSTYQSTWDARMGVMASLSTSQSTGSSSLATFVYDSAGRETGEGSGSCSDSDCSTQSTTNSSRTYDVDNHTIDTTQTWLQQKTNGNTLSSANVSVYDWGPSDHPIRIGSADSSTNTPPPDTAATYDTLHWDGDQLIFSTRNSTSQVDDIKVGSSGDITPQDSSYQGITFWDRGPGGAVVYCHNASGSSGSGQVAAFPPQMIYWSSPCSGVFNQPPSGQFPSSISWFNGPLTGIVAGKPRFGGIGQGWVLGMYRPDGISDGANTIQGIRVADSNTGSWTTPDAFTGVVGDPTTQKSYMWSGNNPIAYSDPSGYLTVAQSKVAGFDGGTWVGDWGSGELVATDDGGDKQLSGGASLDGAVTVAQVDGEDEKDAEAVEAGDPAVDIAGGVSNPIGNALDNALLTGSPGDQRLYNEQTGGAARAIGDHLTRSDLAGAISEYRGVDTGFDHVKEVRDAIFGLIRRADILQDRAASTSNVFTKLVFQAKADQIMQAAQFFITTLQDAGAGAILR